MHEKRKCCHCGRKPDSSSALYRFPKPGVTNRQRCEEWAKYCFPEQNWSSAQFQRELYSSHKMLCSRHFRRGAFLDFSNKRIHKNAFPENEEHLVFSPSDNGHSYCKIQRQNSYLEPMSGPSISTVPCEQPAAPKVFSPCDNGHSYCKKQNSYLEPMLGPSISTDPCEQPAALKVTDREHANSVIQPEAVESISVRSKVDCNEKPSATKPRDVTKSKVSTENEMMLYKKCRKYVKDLCRLRSQIKKLKKESVLKVLSKDGTVSRLLNLNMSGNMTVLLQGQLRNCKLKSKGRRWNKASKILALRMYKRSPACYKLLRRLYCLPTQSTLKALLSNMPLEVGINTEVFQVLKQTASSLKPEDNYFILMFDEMSIRKNLTYHKGKDLIEGYQDHATQGRSKLVASYALVFMIVGIRKRIKQPVAYYFSSGAVTADRLTVLLKEVLQSLFDSGINIAATVCDMDGVNTKALKILGTDTEHPYFVLGGREVVALYDPPHLLKCFRNLFLKYNITCPVGFGSATGGSGTAKWEHIKLFYELDNENPNFVFAPALKMEHINPNNKQKMRVKLAAQVLSHSVAAGMFAKIAKGELPGEATVTATMLDKMDKLFDAVNADSPDLKRGKPFSRNLSANSPHLHHFKEMVSFFRNLTLLNSRQRPPSLNGWIQTLNGIERLWRHLSISYKNIKSLATRRLQQDPLENTFGCIRGNCGSNTNPTTGQFVGGLKTALLSNLAHIGVGRNCENDDNSVVSNLGMLLKDVKDVNANSGEVLLKEFDHVVGCTFEENIAIKESGEIQACAYVCGFIVKKLNIDCRQCEKLLLTKDTNDVHIFIDFKEYSDLKKSLSYSTIELINCVENCATYINKFLEENSHEKHLRLSIIESLKNNAIFAFLSNCEEHSNKNIELIVNSVFFICVKRFCCLKNKKFTEEASASALKRKINILKHV